MGIKKLLTVIIIIMSLAGSYNDAYAKESKNFKLFNKSQKTDKFAYFSKVWAIIEKQKFSQKKFRKTYYIK